MSSRNDFHPIATTLTRMIWRWATVCALLIGSLQAAYTYFQVHVAFEAQISEIARTNIPLLSLSLWDIEPETVQQQIRIISEKPQIGFVRLKVKTGQLFMAGDAQLLATQEVRVYAIPAPHHHSGDIGELEIYENPGILHQEVMHAVIVSLLGYGVLTLMICWLIVYFLHRELAGRLSHIARFVSSLTPERLTTPLVLEQRDRHVHDEIDRVVDGFHFLQQGLSDYIAHLDELVAQRTRELQEALTSIQRLSTIDTLTGCFNRRFFNERIIQELERAERYGRPLSLIFCDIDYFKRINDNHGHLVGDQVLQAIAGSFSLELRTDLDWVTRYGGEEFVIVLPETGLQAAIGTAERLRKTIEAQDIALGTDSLRVTASFGVSEYAAGDTVEMFAQRADDRLYEAKREGRNRTRPQP